tara:strand:- start:143 stop:1129 length:987 start_codon:yes stop_codon:yes gene_type:complete
MNTINYDQLIAVTAGDPAGVGPDICLELSNHALSNKIVVLSDPSVLEERAKNLKKNIKITEWDPKKIDHGKLSQNSLFVWPHYFRSDVLCGHPNSENSETVLSSMNSAIDGCKRKIFKGMVTAPVNKAVINQAKFKFTGHTEFIANNTDTETPVMMLAADKFRVALATTHIPLSQVSSSITKEKIINIIEIIHADLKKYFNIQNPKIFVCGLNPHAGESGYLGNEEKTIIEPAIKYLRKKGLSIEGPASADTIFLSEKKADIFLAMYHDQGLPILKYKGFGNAVNVTLGLPFVRTSVDHGTAYDIAGTGKADARSLISAVEMAFQMVN